MDIKKISELIDHVPVIRLAPMLTDVLGYLPEVWQEVPEEKKKEFAKNLLILAMKSAARAA